MISYTALEPASVVSVDSVDQDQAVHNVKSDLLSTVSTALLHNLTKTILKPLYFRCFSEVKRFMPLIQRFNPLPHNAAF